MDDNYRYDRVVKAISGNWHCLVENHDPPTCLCDIRGRRGRILSLGSAAKEGGEEGEERDERQGSPNDFIEVRVAYPGWGGGT